MKRLSLVLNYLAQFILLLSLFFAAGNFLQITKLSLIVIISYLLYRVTVNSISKDELRQYNFMYIATTFIFALYFAGFTYHLQFYILLGVIICAYLGLFSSYLYKEKGQLNRPKKPIKIVNMTVEKKQPVEDFDEILREAKALEKAEKELKKYITKKAVKKTAPKKTVKKKAKPATKKKVVKKTTKKTVKKTAPKKTTKKTVKKN